MIAHFFNMATCYMQMIVVSIAIICICILCEVDFVCYVKYHEWHKAIDNIRLHKSLSPLFLLYILVILASQAYVKYAYAENGPVCSAIPYTGVGENPRCTVSQYGINLWAIAQIESSGNPKAISKDGSYGLHQVTQAVVTDYNRSHNTSYLLQDALGADISYEIANWYLSVEIPRLLKHFRRAATLENRLTAYNMGIGAVLRGKCAHRYIAKYRRLTHDELG